MSTKKLQIVDTITDHVRYNGSQELTDEQKTQARANIDAGTSDFSGSYADLTDIPYATCTTSKTTVNKIATIDGDLSKPFSLQTGAVVYVNFSYANTAASPTLNVQGTGKKPIVQYGTTNVLTTTWNAGAIIMFAYDGTSWVMVNGAIASTSTYGLTKLSSSTGSDSTAEAATPSAVKSAYSLANAAMPKSGGTFTGNVMAGSDYQAAATSLLRNSSLVSTETDPTVNGEICWLYS